jgi:HTH-type transcriptional regulator / antitoxin HigA
MDLQAINNEQEYDALMEWIDEQFDNEPDINSDAGIKLQNALLLIKSYEDQHYNISAPDSPKP